MNKLGFVVLFYFALFFNVINAETYYINKNSGNDSNSGLTPEQAWENIEKVNGFTFSPGDSVLFSRGSTWHSTFWINSSGTEGNPIYYGAYGEGRKPTFDMQFKPKETMLVSNNASYGILENMVFKNSNGNPPNHANGVFFKNSHHWYVNKIEIYRSGNVSLSMNAGSTNFFVDSTIVMWGTNNGIQSNGWTPASSNIRVENCYVSHIFANDCYVIHKGYDSNGDLVEQDSNFTFRNNYAEYGAEEGFDITSGTNLVYDHNITKSNKNGSMNVGHSVRDVTITNHIAYAGEGGSSRMIIGGEGDVTFKGNLVFGIHPTPMMTINTSNVEITHNTFVWEGQYSDGIMIQWDTDSLTFKNNILATSDEFYGRITVTDNVKLEPTRYKFDYNMYFGKWPDFVHGGNFYSLATWRNTFKQDSNSVVRNPYFLDPASGDFTLSDSSWGIDNADSSDRYGEVDMLGTPIPYGNGADIGAFEFKPGVAFVPPATPDAPDNLTLELIAGTKVKLRWNDNSDNEYGFHIMRAVNGGEFDHLDFAEVNIAEYIDSTVTNSIITYSYRVKAINNKGNSANTDVVDYVTSVEEGLQESTISEFALIGNYPNPFNPATTIKYQTPKNVNVKISIYNTVGELVKILFEGNVSAGSHSVTWNGKDRSGNSVTSGVYFYRINASAMGIHSQTNSASSFMQTKKMLLLK
ncbi:MAG: T9SS type A sorting domain-containing protein [Melioribacteraceae bacterium]|nr:T9SS type A sorting domain-containing protein [Melioribacteraceae bacterium]